MRWIGLLGLFCLVLLWPVAALAQEESDDDPDSADTTSADTTNEPVFHIIAAGDTLFSIAVQYDTTIPNLERINNLSPDSILHIGQELVISGVVPLPIGATVLDAPALQQIAGLPDVPKRHLVQGGESIGVIAAQYELDPALLLDANQLDAEATLEIGQSLLIPGLPGDIVVRDYVVQFGDSLEALAFQFNTQPSLLLADDLLLNPHNMMVGQTARLVSRTGSPDKQAVFGLPHRVDAGETLTTIAAAYNLPPLEIAKANRLNYPTVLATGQQLRIPQAVPSQMLPGELTTLKISSEPLRQGEGFTLYLESAEPISPTGRIRFTDIISAPIERWYYPLYEQAFPFAPYEDGHVAIVGLDSFTHPGQYEIELFLDDDPQADFVQRIEVFGVPYGFEQIEVADSAEVRSAENARLSPIYSTYSITATFPLTEPFQFPLDDAYRSSAYGAARSYAGAPVRIFHTGVDFAAPVSTPIRAVADGVVVFSGFTELRGNIVILDHGLGIKTGYFHLSQLLTEVGEVVTRGAAIGALGNTGLSTGPHLHWDVRVHNIAINGLQWLSEPIFPFE